MRTRWTVAVVSFTVTVATHPSRSSFRRTPTGTKGIAPKVRGSVRRGRRGGPFRRFRRGRRVRAAELSEDPSRLLACDHALLNEPLEQVVHPRAEAGVPSGGGTFRRRD